MVGTLMTRSSHPPKKPTTEAGEARRTNALLEELRKEFRTFGEGLQDVRGRVAAVEAEIQDFKGFTTFQKLVSEKMRDDLSSLTSMSRKITADIAAIRDEVKNLSSRLATAESKFSA